MRATAAFVAAVTFSALLASDAAAATPLRSVQDRVSEVLTILADPGFAGDVNALRRQAEIHGVVVDLFDFAAMARRTLGPHWFARSASEQTEFAVLVQDILERSYILTIENYAGDTIAYAGETVERPYATVKSKILTRLGIDLSLDYRLYAATERDPWRVFDILVEGCSVVANFRAQFDRFLSKESFSALVERLRRKNIELMVLRPRLGQDRARAAALMLPGLLSRRRY